jgi:RNA polymerase sigma-70 factor (ECF subfamily)
MPVTSLSLLERVRHQSFGDNGIIRRDNEAWNRLVELYTPLLFHWSLRTGLKESESEDLVQEIFAVLLSKLQTFERHRDGSFRKWLQVVTVNKCKERFRRKHLPAANGHGDADPLSAVADPNTLTIFWEDEYRQQLIQRAMQIMESDFSEKVWQSCWRHVLQNRPAAEVAEELGITANAVRVYSSRVLARLRTELRELLDE